MSGSTIGGVLGAAVGLWVTGGSAQGAQIGWMVGSLVGGAVDPDVIKGQRLSDAQQQTTAEGAPRPIIRGTNVVAGNVIQAGPLKEHKDRQHTGKGGPVQEVYTYTRTYAIRVCEGPIGTITRIWRDDKLVYDTRDPAQWPDEVGTAIRAMGADTARFGRSIAIYTGDESQLPDPSLEALPAAYGGGVGEVNAYRGSCYVVFIDDDLTDRQGSIPAYKFEVSACGESTSSTTDIDWVAGYTGTDLLINHTHIHEQTAFVAGSHAMLRRSTDSGVTWDAVEFISAVEWDPERGLEAVWHEDDIVSPQGYWYIANPTNVGVSTNNGLSFGRLLETAHTIYSSNGTGAGRIGGVTVISNTAWACAYTPATNTTIFKILSIDNTDRDYGNNGQACAIGDIGGVMLVGTEDGKIVAEGGEVLHEFPLSHVEGFAYGLGIGVAFTGGQTYATSVDGGATWVEHTSATTTDIVFARNRFYRKALDTIDSTTDPTDPDSWVVESMVLAGLETGAGMISSDGYAVLATTADGYTAVLPSAYVMPDVSGWYIDNNGEVVGDTSTISDRCTADLAEVVTDICERVGLTADQLDVTALEGIPVRGYVIGHPMPASDALRSLQQAYFFDFPEWGNWPDTETKLRAVLRGGATAFSITDDDLVQSDDDEDTRAQVVEFPRKINLVTSDIVSDYNPTKQTFERRTQNVKAVGEATIALSLATLRDEAAKIVDIMGRVAWEEAAGSTTFMLPEEFSRLTPSDCFHKDSKRWRAEKCDYGDGVVTVQAKRDRISAYTSNATAGEAPGPGTVPSTMRGPTIFAAWNGPALRTSDNVPGVYVAACGLLDGWSGCDLQLSTDLGVTFHSMMTILAEATMGSLAANCDSGATDLITVSLLHGRQVDSASPAQISAGANAFAILSTGVPEIGQFATATETATVDTYDLSDLTRGELGTTAALHYKTERFVLLDGAVKFLPLDQSLAGKTLIFRPVSIGTAPANNATYTMVFNPGDSVIDGGVVSEHPPGTGGSPTPPTSGGTGTSSSVPARTHGATVVDPVTYGASTAASAATNSAAFNAAYAALPGDGGIVRPSAGTYLIDPTVIIKPLSNTQLDLSTNDVTLQETYTATDHKYGVWIDGESNVEIVGGHIIGYRDAWSPISGTTSEWGHCIFISNGSTAISIKNTSISKAVGDAISIGNSCSDVKIDNCLLTNCRRQGVSNGGDGVEVTNTEISYISGTSPQAGIDIEPDAPATSTGTVVDNCHIHHCSGPSIQMYKRGNDVTVQNCTLEYCNRGIYSIDSTGGIVKDNTIRYHHNSGIYLKGASTGWTIGGTGDANLFYGNKTGTYGTPAIGGATTTVAGQGTATAKHLTLDTTASATVGSNTYGPTS